MNRRDTALALLALSVAPLATKAQQPARVARIGFLTTNNPAAMGQLMHAFAQGLQALGYAEGKNILIERRFAEGRLERLPMLAADLVSQKVELILSANTPTTVAARQATSTIPIVFVLVSDPVGSGFVESLARPGGNATGTTQSAPDLTAKRLQILKEAFPKISRLAVFTSKDSVVGVQLPGVEQAAKVLNIEILPIEVRSRDDFEGMLKRIRKWRADSLYCLETPFTFNNRDLLAEFAAMARLPAVYAVKEYALARGLMSYGADYNAIYYRAASYVDRILKGVVPRDLPVELPTKFELIINLSTAKALGLKIPQSVLARADEVIQ